MTKHRSNGHANGQASKDFVRAPAGGMRVGGKYYRPGARLPERYRRAVEQGELSQDPATGLPLSPPNFGRFPLPHAMTFIGKQSTISNIYRNPDEAVRHSSDSWKMRRDPSIMECLEARQRGTALLSWHLEVEDEKDPRQKELQEGLTKILKRTHQFTEYRRNLLEALWYGRYAVQHSFGFQMIDGKRCTVIEDWRPINGDKLVFRFDDGSGKYKDGELGVRTTPIFGQKDVLAGQRRLEPTDRGMAYFFEPWERSLLAVHKHIIEDGDYEDPISAGRIHGVGIRDRIYWCWFQKQETMAQMMEVIDRTGSGITIYWYPASNPQAKEEVEDMAERQKHENVLVMPRMSGDPALDQYGIERIEPTTAGIQAMQEVVDGFFGNQVMRYINGGTLYSKSESLGIGGGGADFQEASFHQIIEYDAVKLEETITQETINRALKPYNFPWAHDIPVWFRIDTDSPDAQEKLEAAKLIWDMGGKIKTAELMSKVGLSIPGDDEEFLQNPQFAMGAGMPGAMPGEPGAAGQPQDDMHHLFGPLADMLGDEGGEPGAADGSGQPAGGEPPASHFPGAAKYSRDWHEQLARAIADTDAEPSEEQKSAGNYRKGKLNWNGLTITLENPAGTKRRPEWKPLANHYGYINRTEGRDGDHVDCFLGPGLDSGVVFVVDQEHPVGNHFDEHKCLLGFYNSDDAREAYLANYEPDWHVGPITALTVEQFKNWLADGDTTERVEHQVSRYAKAPIGLSDLGRRVHGRLQQIVDAFISADPGYGHVFWNPDTNEVRGVTSDGDSDDNDEITEFIHDLKECVGEENVRVDAEYAPRECYSPPWVKIKRHRKSAAYSKRHKSAAGQTSLWQEELHPRIPKGDEDGGQFTDKDQPQTFSDLASKLGHLEGIDDSPKAKAASQELFQTLAGSEVPPEQLAALLSGDDERLSNFKAQSENPPSSSAAEQQARERIPGASAPGREEGGFSLEQKPVKIGQGIGTGDKAPDTSKGRQEAFFHGLDDKPGQEKLFEGLDLAGGTQSPVDRDGYHWKQNSAGKWAWFDGPKQISGAYPEQSDSDYAFKSNSLERRSSPAKDVSIEDHPDFARLNRAYGHMTADDLTEKLTKMDRDIASLQKQGQREFDQRGGRRSGPAVAAQGARDIGSEKLLLAAYRDHKFGKSE